MIAVCKEARRRAGISLGWILLGLGLGAVLATPAAPATPAGGADRTAASTAGAPYHNGATSICADCHDLFGRGAAERAGAHGDERVTARALDPPGRAATARWHLKAESINQLCLSCHDGVRGIPDVAGADVNGLRQRSAGAFAPVSEGRGHPLGADLTCISCHDPHGNGKARNLRLPSDPDGETAFGLFPNPGATGLARYERENVAYGTLDSPSELEATALCLDCHGDLDGRATEARGSHGGYLLHPSYDSRRGAPNRISQGSGMFTSDPRYWNDGTGSDFQLIGRVPFLGLGAADYASASQIDASRNAVFCLSCHQAHGSEHPFALRWSRTGPDGVAGCNQCHAKGRGRGAGVELAQAAAPPKSTRR